MVGVPVGLGGNGGTGGGGSFAIWRFNSNTGANVQETTLVAGAIGTGGNGANGQPGNAGTAGNP